MAAHFYDDDFSSKLTQKRNLSQFLIKKVQKFLPEKKKIRLDYVFCTDQNLIEKNLKYLNHDTFTDILTFDLSEKEDELIAEIHISGERVKENSQKFKTTYQQELHRVIFHGMLHLCGFNDHTAEEQKEMRHQEQVCLDAYFK